jgi:3-oxoacyl-[acyl-carrier protein] reductase
MNYELSNKVAVITGGSRGIGEAVAVALAREGASVVFTFRNRKRDAERALEKLHTYTSEAYAVKADVSKTPDVKKVIDLVVRKFKRIDILVNNAGIWTYGEIGKMTEKLWDETIDINLKGMFLFTNAAAPLMKKQKAGKIINIASTAGQRGEAFHSHYAASKGGMIAFTKSVAVELAPFGINVNCVSPGWVDTEMSASELSNKKKRKEAEEIIPRGKVATAHDIVGAVLFLCSESSAHMIGASINLNGGSVLV